MTFPQPPRRKNGELDQMEMDRWFTAIWVMLSKPPVVPDSTATTVAGLVADYNALLATLRASGRLAP